MDLSLQQLRDRKLFQWAVAYLAAAWALLEAIDIVAGQFAWPALIGQIAVLIAVCGLFVTLILAWYHGEKGRQRVSGPELLMIALLLVVTGAVLSMLSPDAEPAGGQALSADDESLPLVIIMDSPHSTRVYDEEVLAANGTNADVISDILLDLPIRRQKEAIGANWHRDEEISSFEPDLVIIHYSGFRQDFEDLPRPRLRLFMSYLADSDTKFLIYSRRSEARLRELVTGLLADLDAEHPGLTSRVRVFGLDDYGPPKWLHPSTSTHLKLAVKEMLGL
ncbi:MAG: hypothetical protein JSW46_20570 [Gemmatimonadota bacterium]|nr:MAG: hypothetical protein JSW46_20570 [Gemmatimonadota bacterium]